jgi:hypothetical protein
MKLYYKRYDLNLPIVNSPFICSNIPAACQYGLYTTVDTALVLADFGYQV